MKNTRRNACTGVRYAMPVRVNYLLLSVKLKLTLTLTLTLTDIGGTVLTIMLGYRSLEKIVSYSSLELQIGADRSSIFFELSCKQ